MGVPVQAHVPLYSYRSGGDALRRFRGDREACESGRLQLGGPAWRFKVFENPSQVPGHFHEPEFDEQDEWDQARASTNLPERPLQQCLGMNTPCNSIADLAWKRSWLQLWTGFLPKVSLVHDSNCLLLADCSSQ